MSKSRTVAAAGAVLTAGLFYLALLKATTRSAEGDFLDSELFWWGWLVLPAVAVLAAAVAPRGVDWWGWLVVAPQAVGVFVEGALFHDPDHGASFWPVGLALVLVLGFVSSQAARFRWPWRR